MIKVIELFGGIGACSKALERLNIEHEVIDYVEIDKYAVKSYNAMYGTNFEPQDITTYDKDIEVDLVIGGFPCQDISIAGQQKGIIKGETRSGLMYEMMRIIEKTKPKYVIAENVRNLLSDKFRPQLEEYLCFLNDNGYKVTMDMLNSKDYGVPQHRERVFIIGVKNEDIYDYEIDENGNMYKKCEEILNKLESEGKIKISDYQFPPKQELKLKLKDMLEDEVDEKYYLSEDKINSISHWKAYQKPFEKVQGKNSIVPTLTARGAGEEHSGMITYSDRLEETTNLQEECLHIKNATKKGYKKAYDGDSVNLAYPKSETRRGRVGKEVSQTLQCNDNMGVVDSYVSKKYSDFEKENGYIPELFNPYNKKEITDIVPTQSTYCGSTTSSATVLLKDNLRIRKLTPKECFRLMGFDDTDFEKASQVNSNAQLYKQAGNSIVVQVLEVIFRELLGVDRFE